MLHGWGQTQAMFAHQLTGLGARRRVVTYDQRGHGVSDKPHHGYRIARLAQDLVELLDHLGLDRADLLGWSMGASVLWSHIDTHGTGRIGRLVLVDQPAAVAAVPWMPAQEQAGSGAIFDVGGLLDLAGSLAGPDGDTVREAFVRSMFSGTPPTTSGPWSPGRSPTPPPTPGYRCCSTTAHRTGATCSPGSTSRRWCSGARAAT
nr:alpha/beta hydrolase [Pseudonocardia sp. AL041005-10]